MGAYLVVFLIAALGVALGWRLTPAPRADGPSAEGLTRLIQLAIALTSLLVLSLLLMPWLLALPEAACTIEVERASECVVGVREGPLFGASAFACAIGAAFAYVARKGVFDLPGLEPEEAEGATAPALGEVAGETEAAAAESPDKEAEEPEAAAKTEPAATEPAAAEPAATEPAATEPAAAEPEAAEPAGSDAKPEGHRKLEGPVHRAFVDDHIADLDVAIRTAVERLSQGGKRVAVVYSEGASKDANLALDELAQAFDAYRYVLEGTAAATEGLPSAETPNPSDADEIAGPDARHAGELALDLAGSLIETVMLLDTRVAFPEFVLGRLTELQSVCIAHAHDDVSAACQVLLPGTNPGEKEGELLDTDGSASSRRNRVWLVNRMIEVLRERQGSDSDAEGDSSEPEKDAAGESSP
ncbi:hypothetical protein G6O69_32785 [Pseudenhygromyxa sp. WMMC2535]|uniref:hypothetical protein n=1 Tax=Pseudenhygromyxa sp. WMMC2535 TaxID=2712867 RepID=UPI00155660E2|nr:hypothetical protein [Pseudenhygromyxa sp. WMMC2535]NVB42645.1 hypothetical protein [Pseudenhygromyxa sp. WMMC2535]